MVKKLFENPVKAVITVLVFILGLRLLFALSRVDLSPLQNLTGSAAESPSSGANNGGSGAERQPAVVGQTTTQPSDTSEAADTTAIESFQTDCHIVRVYQQSETLRMSVLSKSEECNIVSGDYPATTSSGSEGTEYVWEQEGTKVRAFIPTSEDPSALEFSGANVPGQIKVEYAEEESAPPVDPPPTVDPPSTNLDYENGLDRGYRQGYQDGQSMRRSGAGFDPDLAYDDIAMTGNASYDRGFSEGFYEGFTDGYYSLTGGAIEQPVSGSLTCVGQVGISQFAVYYTYESGFSRVEFRPQGVSSTLTAYLTYSGTNQQGQDVWRGAVNNMADVTVLHLSTQQPRPGDAVQVNYADQLGQGTCQSAIYGWW
ncbi:MAG: hypothetical protein WBA57_02440 [Elainellaceae cyanobacterium]